MDRNKLTRMLIRDEGLRLYPYRCTAGKLTIGVGRNLDDVGISKATAEQMLGEDLKRAEDACLSIFGAELWQKWGENRKAGWMNFMFNLGVAGVLGFKNTLKAAIGGNFDEVERHLRASKYASQVKSRAERVIAMICREEFPYD